MYLLLSAFIKNLKALKKGELKKNCYEKDYRDLLCNNFKYNLLDYMEFPIGGKVLLIKNDTVKVGLIKYLLNKSIPIYLAEFYSHVSSKI